MHLDVITTPTNVHKFVKTYYKRSNTSYMFRPLMWPSTGTCVTKNKCIEMLRMLVYQYRCKSLNIKMTWFKIRIIVEKYG
jgi:hypothetical protein